MTPAELSARFISPPPVDIARKAVPPKSHTNPEPPQLQRELLDFPRSQPVVELERQPLLGMEIWTVLMLLQRSRRQLKEDLEVQETGNG